MTYEGSAHMTEAERLEKAAYLRKLATLRESRARARRRENIEDSLLVIVVALVALILGIRVERVYLAERPEPVECSSQDEISVSFDEDAYGNDVGTQACVHVDAVQIAP